MSDVAHLLRAEGRYAVRGDSVPLLRLTIHVVIGGFLCGAVIGSFGLRPMQSLYSGLKVPLLLAVSTAVCLPSFYAVNAALGLRDDFAAAARGVLASQATLAITLAALAPVTAVIYASSTSYRLAVVGNGVLFALATAAGQITLARHYRPLLRSDPRHRVPLSLWVVLYVFVAIQGAWVLRPFIGAPALRPSFLRPDLWTNAYVVVARTVWELLGGKS